MSSPQAAPKARPRQRKGGAPGRCVFFDGNRCTMKDNFKLPHLLNSGRDVRELGLDLAGPDELKDGIKARIEHQERALEAQLWAWYEVSQDRRAGRPALEQLERRC